jgi:hypothetical protein
MDETRFNFKLTLADLGRNPSGQPRYPDREEGRLKKSRMLLSLVMILVFGRYDEVRQITHARVTILFLINTFRFVVSRSEKHQE